MCGIAGIIQLDSVVDEGQLIKMADAIHHRGPDDRGQVLLHMGDTQIGLASRRLSIIDLSSAGHMPMSNADRTIWITYNGEIYNHLRLREELVHHGVNRFHSRTDTETLLYAYQEFGLAAFSKLDGMFAAAIVDLRNFRVILARDRMGIKPLYYHWDGNELIFASELKAILANPKIARRIDFAALDIYLALGYVPSPYCLVSGVRKLEPGHYLLLENQQLYKDCFWAPCLNIPKPDFRSKTDLVQSVRYSVNDAVQAQLMSDVPVGVFLSGGLDSTIIATLAAESKGKNLHTFTIGFQTNNSPMDDVYNQDFYAARQVAQKLGSEHHEVIIQDDEVLAQQAEKLLVAIDEPVIEASNLSIYVMALAAKESGVKVILTGDGADELFGGYPWHWAGLRLEHIEQVPFLKRSLNLADRLLPPGTLHTKFKDLSQKYRQPAWVKYQVNYSYFDSQLRDALITSPQSENNLNPFLQTVLEPVKDNRVADQYGYADLYLWVREHFNQRVDRMMMLASVEGRVPYQHNAVVDLALSIGMERKISGREQKILLKEAFPDKVPQEVIQRPKRPFATPMLSWLQGVLNDYANELFFEDTIASLGFLHPQKIQAFTSEKLKYLPSHPEDKKSLVQVWNLLALCTWARALAITG